MTNLRIPGPTPCPPEVLEAMAGQMVNHRGPEFAELLYRVTEGLRRFFQTTNDVLILTTSGTGAMEAMVVNALSPGDRVLVVTTGAFGVRFAQIAETYGARVSRLEVPWGQAADPEAVQAALAADPAIKAVLLTHSETSTGVTNDLEALAAVCRQFGVLTVVDGISSLGAIPLPVDEWGLDFVATASQKGWMVPPGLAMVAVSDRGWQAYQQATMPRFYFDLGKAKSFLEKGQTPWTPAVSVFYALDVALQLMEQEGREAIYERHRRVGEAARAGVKGLGLTLFADEGHASNTVTAVNVPQGIDGSVLVKHLRTQHGVVLAGGQGPLAGKIFRIGHLGLVTEPDIDATLAALERALAEVAASAGGVRT